MLESYRNLKLYIRLRWISVLLLGSTGILQNYFLRSFSSQLFYSVAAIIVLLVINAILVFWLENIKNNESKLQTTATWLIYFDLLLVFGAVYTGGGIESGIIFFPLVFLIASVFKHLKFIYAVTATTVLIYVGLVTFDTLGLITTLGIKSAWHHNPHVVYPLLVFNVVVIYAYVLVYTYVIRTRDEREETLKKQAKEIAVQTKELRSVNKELTEERNRAEQANTILKKKLAELERVYRFTLGREKRIIDLKDELKRKTTKRSPKK